MTLDAALWDRAPGTHSAIRLLLAAALAAGGTPLAADRSVYHVRRGSVVRGEEGAAAVGRYGARGAVATEDAAARWGPRGGVAVGEEGAVAVGRYGRGYGVVYEDDDDWKVAAGLAAGISIGTMLRKPPAQSTTVVVGGSSYYYAERTFYTRVSNGGEIVYQAVAPPAGAVIATLPAGCSARVVGGVSYQHCGGADFMRVSGGYQVVILP